MDIKTIITMASLLVLVIGVGLLSACLVGYYSQDALPAQHGLYICTGSCLLASVLGIALCWRHSRNPWGHSVLRECFLAVLVAWIAAVAFGALPFVVCCDFHVTDAIFETASGFSTTGSTIVEPGMSLASGKTLEKGLEELPQSILYWRCLLNWLGGIGFVMFVLMILPAFGVAKQLYNAEVPGLKSAGDQLTPRIATTARLMILCYVICTFLITILYRVLGMESYLDALCHAFSTVATGGFSTHTDSFGYYRQPALQWAGTLGMFFSSLNFILAIKLIMQRRFEYHKDEEVRLFTIIALGWSLLFALQMRFKPAFDGHSFEELLRISAFQVVSLMSTTGFATSDYLTWNLPGLPTGIIILMLCGGCCGSTAGGIKMARILVACKQSLGEIKRKIFPHLAPNVKLSGLRIEMTVVHQTMVFIHLYFIIIFLCTLILPFLSDMDFDTAFSAVISSISNVGPGLGKIGPACTYAWMSPTAKILLSVLMIAGRLELYTILVVFMPCFWKTALSLNKYQLNIRGNFKTIIGKSR